MFRHLWPSHRRVEDIAAHYVPSCLQGDFLVHLLESAESGPSTPLGALAPHQLQGLLDAALRSSSLAASPHVDVVCDGALAIKLDTRTVTNLVLAAANPEGQQVGGLVLCWHGGLAWWAGLVCQGGTFA
jgi:hypothetical protein